MGAVTPLGNDVESTWEGAVAGRSGVDFITTFDTERLSGPYRCRGEGLRRGGAGLVQEHETARPLHPLCVCRRRGRRSATRESTATSRTVSALCSALASAAFTSWRASTTSSGSAGQAVSRPAFLPNVLADSASGQIAIALGIRGPELRGRLGLRHRLPCHRLWEPSSCAAATPTRCWPAAPRRVSIRCSLPASARCAVSWPRTRIRRGPLGRSTRHGPGS